METDGIVVWKYLCCTVTAIYIRSVHPMTQHGGTVGNRTEVFICHDSLLRNPPPISHQNKMACCDIVSITTDAAKTGHAHATALLAAPQAKQGDKLPLKETVKETDATTPITLAPSGKTIFVRSSTPSHTPPFIIIIFYAAHNADDIPVMHNPIPLPHNFF